MNSLVILDSAVYLSCMLKPAFSSGKAIVERFQKDTSYAIERDMLANACKC